LQNRLIKTSQTGGQQYNDTSPSVFHGEALEMHFIWLGFGLTKKYKSRLERLAKDKHSCLLQTFVSYGQKSLVTLTPDFWILSTSAKLDISGFIRIFLKFSKHFNRGQTL
jgi:hypothetical protein